MPRQNTFFIPDGESLITGGSQRTNNMIDYRVGGQFGFGGNFKTWINSAVHVSRPLISLLVEPPVGFTLLPKPHAQYWVDSLRHMVEQSRIRVEGLQHKLTVSIEETPMTGSGQVQEVFTDVKEERPNISFTWPERQGMGYSRFIQAWIRTFMMNQETKFASANTIPGMQLTDLLPDIYSMTMLFIEPDENRYRVNQAWLVGNMFPKDSGENSAKSDVTTAQEKREITIPFTGFAHYGPGVDYFAQQVLDNISQTGADPYLRQSWIDSLDGSNPVFGTGEDAYGYANSVDTIRRRQVHF